MNISKEVAVRVVVVFTPTLVNILSKWDAACTINATEIIVLLSFKYSVRNLIFKRLEKNILVWFDILKGQKYYL